MDKELNREITSLESEKRMDELALKGYQHSIAEQLNGAMGKDMTDVLSGNKKVKFSFWRRIKNGFDKLLWNLSLER
jgi:hypothetical protein